MQLLFGIPTNKYSSLIPTTFPENVSQLMKVFFCLHYSYKYNYFSISCWQSLPYNRPTFCELYEQINKIIEIMIYIIWNQMKKVILHWDKEIRDCERVMLELTIAQNNQRLELEK
ncbi:unnamed protein product [Rotaria socialis]|uniref:Uncharacterized protein n=1 Tax=Rotaria socialis TaxID=392032 RepID=A0A818JIQ0_9BILA|nr:unnamed protein product [Rotaria socialis]CAF3334849.1 unnamed protein product [Rotaria socialis]CAF3542602.1 unnamed protein product [Rotaria socialis]CAF4320389.1 unnamed protein product [Rotaria socialis]CAF4347668.1 unnamed protein product [Rotaria socialis]